MQQRVQLICFGALWCDIINLSKPFSTLLNHTFKQIFLKVEVKYPSVHWFHLNIYYSSILLIFIVVPLKKLYKKAFITQILSEWIRTWKWHSRQSTITLWLFWSLWSVKNGLSSFIRQFPHNEGREMKYNPHTPHPAPSILHPPTLAAHTPWLYTSYLENKS